MRVFHLCPFVCVFLFLLVLRQMWDLIVSYDVSVIQWITYVESYDHTCNNTLARTRNVIDNVRVNNAFFIDIMIIVKAMK